MSKSKYRSLMFKRLWGPMILISGIVIGAVTYLGKKGLINFDDNSSYSHGSSITNSQSYEPTSVPYEVRPGDNVYRIARNHGLTQDELVKYNNLSPPYTIYPKQTLLIPVKRSTITISNNGSSFNGWGYYVNDLGMQMHRVKYGETLWGLSQIYGTTVKEIKKLNNDFSEPLKEGDRLQIAE